MNKIGISVLNPDAVQFTEQMMVCAARLTQRGHRVKDVDDLVALYERPYTPLLIRELTSLPHPTMQKLAVINVAVVGASRRFLAQITRHQNEVKFMSASLQYSDYTSEADFTVPYAVLEQGEAAQREFLLSCEASAAEYEAAIAEGLDNDAAGYLMPQALRNALLISATPYQWKHMIRQRTCRRNTDETRYVMLKSWSLLYALSPELFSDAGPFCMRGPCQEGKMACGDPIDPGLLPEKIIKADYPLLCKGGSV